MNIEDFKGLMDEFDPLSLLPEVSEVTGAMGGIARFIVLIGPVVLLVMGLLYRFATPKEANHHWGYRTYFGMGSVEAWRFAQRFAGFIYMILGGVMTFAMLIVSIVLIGKDTITLLTIAAICLVIEAILTGLAVLGINIYLAVLYDRDGYRRGAR